MKGSLLFDWLSQVKKKQRSQNCLQCKFHPSGLLGAGLTWLLCLLGPARSPLRCPRLDLAARGPPLDAGMHGCSLLAVCWDSSRACPGGCIWSHRLTYSTLFLHLPGCSEDGVKHQL